MRRGVRIGVGAAVAGVCLIGHGAADEWRAAQAMGGDKSGPDVVKVRSKPATSDGMNLEYSMPELRVVTEAPKTAVASQAADASRTVLLLGNAPLAGNEGEPVLPVVPCYVVLPQGHVVEKVTVKCGLPEKLPGKHAIRHGARAIPLSSKVPHEPARPNPLIYESDAPWPRERFEVVSVQRKRGVSVLIVNLNPVSYRPKSGRVSCYRSMGLNVKTRPAPVEARLASKEGISAKYRPDPINPLAEQVDNPDVLGTYEGK